MKLNVWLGLCLMAALLAQGCCCCCPTRCCHRKPLFHHGRVHKHHFDAGPAVCCHGGDFVAPAAPIPVPPAPPLAR